MATRWHQNIRPKALLYNTSVGIHCDLIAEATGHHFTQEDKHKWDATLPRQGKAELNLHVQYLFPGPLQ